MSISKNKKNDNSLSIDNDDDLLKIFDAIDSSNSVALICHDTPDPDCIGPAQALSEYCASKNISSKILYGGDLSHLQNKALVNVLGIEMKEFSSLIETNEKEDITKYIDKNFDLIIILDTSSYGGKGNMKFINNVPGIIIDHHQGDVDLNGDLENILYLNHKCGSASSIIAHMFEKKRIALSKESGTSLFIGLMSDTNFLSCAAVSEIDQNANKYLLQYVDFALYTRIMNYEMPDELLRIKKLAYGNYFFRENTLAIIGIGYLKPEFKDLLAIIAEEIVRVEGVQKVVVVGIIEERDGSRAVSASVRTSADTTNTGAFCKRIFGEKYAGAKQGAGGAYVKLSDFDSEMIETNETNKESYFQMVYDCYKKIILEVHTNA